MDELVFHHVGAERATNTMSPTIMLRLRASRASVVESDVCCVALRCQIRIDPGRRRYTDAQREALRDVFGPPEDWGRTLHPMLWQQTGAIIPRLELEAPVDLPLTCGTDFDLAAVRYCQTLDEGDVPLLLLFSGTVFSLSPETGVHARPIPHHTECRIALPSALWRESLDEHATGLAPMRLDRSTLARLGAYKARAGIRTWDGAISTLLDTAGARESAFIAGGDA